MRPHLHNQRLLQLLADNSRTGSGIRSAVRGDVATLYLYDVIDPFWGVSALDVASALVEARNASQILLRINSPGGDVFEGRAIASLLRDVGDRLSVQIDGLAASAATTVALAAPDLPRMMPGSFFMIHKAWALTAGNDDELLSMAGLLGKIDGELANEYAAVSGLSAEDIMIMMKAETWMTADEARSNGFAAEVPAGPSEDDPAVVALINAASDPDRAYGIAFAARWNLAAYAKAPKLPAVSQAKPVNAADADTDPAGVRRRRLHLRSLNH